VSRVEPHLEPTLHVAERTVLSTVEPLLEVISLRFEASGLCEANGMKSEVASPTSDDLLEVHEMIHSCDNFSYLVYTDMTTNTPLVIDWRSSSRFFSDDG
jgi:hypothetical protein